MSGEVQFSKRGLKNETLKIYFKIFRYVMSSRICYDLQCRYIRNFGIGGRYKMKNFTGIKLRNVAEVNHHSLTEGKERYGVHTQSTPIKYVTG